MNTSAPNEHVLALVNYFALLPLVYFIPDWLAPITGVNKLLHVASVLALIVPVISYLVMPTAVKLLSKKSV
ncbi:hypothetical protein [Pseudoalteromonas luteoviolacea]|uniref:Uncharacterized protein n=1 Tax=Pseudoalteromonas luteoviolacea S4054 TaxID=1129367 RepID=A0A0F6A8S2_9GAMM|nr:hypothetical protein [Pseudoalteromonas luteoviolacea]AOT10877.1 hypothetical protein S4054249_23830 [Pseudoalteromonas luteoviolacea]AOT15960.1 hypothetical protein S40542_24680 [Pseudoalteromonas luteoviolacea]AOT20698.1 hypothetical protein S4054_23750 [Pseudoalteromonas luteoviolacea]KKE81799.1 hypothetical protein N479_02230 [Pseudoalteromonas luteoviolacea S4054]KZN66243.1 hypothetical protein N481_24850 [Pseudoalteromonas luteoviolacea S4047-1]